MSDEHDPTEPAPSRWHLQIDLRDVMGVGGAVIVLAGAATVHIGLALIVAGVAVCALAYRLSR